MGGGESKKATLMVEPQQSVAIEPEISVAASRWAARQMGGSAAADAIDSDAEPQQMNATEPALSMAATRWAARQMGGSAAADAI